MLRIFLCEGVSVGLLFGEFLFYEAEKKGKKNFKATKFGFTFAVGKK